MAPGAANPAAAAAVLTRAGSRALQYGPSEGLAELRDWIAAEVGRRGIKAAATEVLVTNGSQQVLDLIGKLFLDPGDVVLTDRRSDLPDIQTIQTGAARN